MQVMDLSKNLKLLLKERGMKITSLSQKTGVPTQTLHNWLSGMEPRSLNQVHKVASFLDVTIDELCFGRSKKEKQSISQFKDEINAGIFEVILRKPQK